MIAFRNGGGGGGAVSICVLKSTAGAKKNCMNSGCVDCNIQSYQRRIAFQKHLISRHAFRTSRHSAAIFWQTKLTICSFT